jgi:hypothetical protein
VQTGAKLSSAGWRKGIFATEKEGGNVEHSNIAEGIVSEYIEAMQRRLKGISLRAAMPSQFDVGAWIEHFEKLLTLTAVQ